MNLYLLSMEELSKLAKDVRVPELVRREALHALHSREAKFYQKLLYVGNVSKYYVSDL
jgi:hypothetical protein